MNTRVPAARKGKKEGRNAGEVKEVGWVLTYLVMSDMEGCY